MEQNNLSFSDKSNDKKYFAIIPYYIVNHSTAYEQSLYLIMKRKAGEETQGRCFASLNYLAQNMGVHKNTVTKTIKKLLKRGWIKEINPIIVPGGKVRCFIIIDLWELNMKFYGGGADVSTLPPRGGAVVHRGGAQSNTKKKQEEETKYIYNKKSKMKKIFIPGYGSVLEENN